MSWFFKKKKTARQITDLEREAIDEILSRKVYVPTSGNWMGNKYAERLVKEWLDYGKIVLSLDWDDTLSPWGFTGFEANMEFLRTIKVIKLAQSVGCYTTIFTACDSSRFEEIKNYCENKGIHVDSINENPIPLKYGNGRKIYYNWNLCDRSGLEQARSILEYACYRVISDRKPKIENFDT